MSRTLFTLLPVLSLLAACAGNQAYNDGQAMLGAGRTEQGLALLEQAAQAEPTNAKYRIAVTNGRMRAPAALAPASPTRATIG